MIVSLEYIERKFKEYNDLYFERKLKPLPFKISTQTFLGQVSFMREKNPDGTWHYYDFVFHINTKIYLPEAEVKDTILHEIIHYWILSNQMQDTTSHGEIFIKKMKEINIKYNRNLSVSHKVTKEGHDKDTEVQQHLICVSKPCNSRHDITIATKSRLFQLWDEIPNFPNIAEWKLVVSTALFFNRFPRASSLKIYSMHTVELEEHLKDAKELERRSNSIMIKKLYMQ